MFAQKPIIGILGGIGSGKSFIADLFGELGCLAIHSDKLIDEAYNTASVRRTIAKWWGAEMLAADGAVNRRAVGAKIFADPVARRKLERLLHPKVARRRLEMMTAAAEDGKIPAFVWDSPLLAETGMHTQCDALVFIQAPDELRLLRVAGSRGWDKAELTRRENLQQPLDKKREISEYVIDNTADADYARGQVKEVVKEVLSRIRGQ